MSSDLYSKKYNVRLFHCPKCAMTSMRHNLLLEWTKISDIPSDAINVFVYRNVLDRFVSAYFQIKKTYNRNSIKHFKKYFVRDISEEDVLHALKSPENYLNEILENGFWDSHQMPQKYYADSIHERSLENIDLFLSFKDLRKYFSRLGIEESKTVNQNKHPRKKEIYNFFKTKSKEIDYLYKEDFTIINYEPKSKKKIDEVSWN